MINVALFGLGRIGQMHAENLFNNKSFKLKFVYDVDYKLTQKISKKFNCVGLKNYKNLTRWYSEISRREAVIKGYNFMKSGETIPKP